MRAYLHTLVQRPVFTRTVMQLILANAVLVGFETYPSVYEAYSGWIYWLDLLLLWAFTLEIAMRLLAARRLGDYFRDGWNVFDFVIVFSGHFFTGGSFITVMRTLRVLRLLRTISILPSLRRIVNALLLTLPSLANISLLLSILLYIFAVSGTMMFGDAMPEYFGSLHLSLLTLFQVITLDSWSSGLMRPLMELYPLAWIYFVAFVLFGTFIVMNLIVGVIVTNLDRANAAQAEPPAAAADLHGQAPVLSAAPGAAEVAALRAEIAELKQMVRELSHK